MDLRDQEFDEVMPAPQQPLAQLLIAQAGRAFFLPTGSIRWIAADDDFVRLYADDQSYRIGTTLTALHARLGSLKFLRIHRSAIVNVDFIAELQATSHGDYDVILIDGTVLKLSRSFRGVLQRFGGVFGAKE